MDLPTMVKIKKIVNESPKVKTFFFEKNFDVKPGQFAMVWLPGVDEKPFSFSYTNAITVEKKGAFTNKLFSLKEGELLGIRGPYGNGFSIEENSCVVAGGLGIAALSILIEKLKQTKIIIGAKTKQDLIFIKRFKKFKPLICTDDGSYGTKGLATDLLKKVLKEKKFKMIYCCGPELMIKKVLEVAENYKIYCEASLERYMKCGIGLCGHCAINQFRVCKDGPVFNSKQLKKMSELGKYARLKSGKKVPLKAYLRINLS